MIRNRTRRVDKLSFIHVNRRVLEPEAWSWVYCGGDELLEEEQCWLEEWERGPGGAGRDSLCSPPVWLQDLYRRRETSNTDEVEMAQNVLEDTLTGALPGGRDCIVSTAHQAAHVTKSHTCLRNSVIRYCNFSK
jgi:hypothetical protein